MNHGFSTGGLAPHPFTPILGVHHPMSRTGGSADASLVMAGDFGALPPVGYFERSATG
jgi:hypothetical protein